MRRDSGADPLEMARTMPPSGVRPGRILRSDDFARVLRTAPRARSAHFALHHAGAAPAQRRSRLSTADGPNPLLAVDDSALGDPAPGCEAAGPHVWLGAVLPKRHARRAVTRNLLRRAIREAARAHAARLRRGLWIVRLRAPLPRAEFPSAVSMPLRRLVRDELSDLFARAGAH